MSITEIIKKLKSIELVPTPECSSKVHELVFSLMGINWLLHPIKAGSILSRCRRGSVDLVESSFGSRSPEFIHDFQRASISGESVFYAAGSDGGKKEYADFIAMLETSRISREKIEKGRELISVSHWLVERDIEMALICHPNIYVNARPSDPISDMQLNYKELLQKYPVPELIDEFDKLVEFISGQFAKSVPEGENIQYMISAYFSHFLLDAVKGIIYPSTKADGHLGFNVALRQDVEKEALVFQDDAYHAVLYKTGIYMSVPAKKFTDDQICTYLNINSISELPIIT